MQYLCQESFHRVFREEQMKGRAFTDAKQQMTSMLVQKNENRTKPVRQNNL